LDNFIFLQTTRNATVRATLCGTLIAS